MADTSTVNMLAPDGTVRAIPQDQVQAAQQAGGKTVSKMLDPQGVARWIPQDQVQAAQQAGGKLVDDSASQQTGFWHTLKQAFFLEPQDTASIATKNPMPADVTPQSMQNFDSAPLRGAEKGLTETLSGTSQLAQKVIEKVKGQAPSGKGIVGEAPASAAETEADGFGEGVGKSLETVMEFMSGDEALKGLSVAQKLKALAPIADVMEKYPRLANVVGTAIRQGTVSTAQGLAHGESLDDSLESGAVTGGLSAGMGAVGEIGSSINNALSKNVAGEGSKLAESLAGKTLSDQPEVVRSVNSKIDAAEQAMHSNYDAGMNRVSQAAQDVPINISGSPLQQTATDLLGDSDVPTEISSSLKGVVPDNAKIQPLLEELATSNKTYSWNDLEATRQQLGQQIRRVSYDSPIKGDLIKLRSAIDDTMQKAAADAGKPELAEQIQSVRNSYAQSTQQITENSIKALRNDPDSVAKVLLNKTDSISRIQNLRSLIGPDNMKEVEGSIFSNMLDRATQGDQFNPNALKRAFYNMAPDVRQAVWGDRVADVKRFVDAAANSPLSKIKGAATTAALGLGAWKIATSNDPLSTAKNELILGLSGLGALHLSPRALSNPAVLKTVGSFMEQAGKPGARKAMAAAANQVMMAVHSAGAQDNGK